MRLKPGWCKKLQNIKPRGSVVVISRVVEAPFFLSASDFLLSSWLALLFDNSSWSVSPCSPSSISLSQVTEYSPVYWSRFPSIKISKKYEIEALSVSSSERSTAQKKGWESGFSTFGNEIKSTLTWPNAPFWYKTEPTDSQILSKSIDGSDVWGEKAPALTNSAPENLSYEPISSMLPSGSIKNDTVGDCS